MTIFLLLRVIPAPGQLLKHERRNLSQNQRPPPPPPHLSGNERLSLKQSRLPRDLKARVAKFKFKFKLSLNLRRKLKRNSLKEMKVLHHKPKSTSQLTKIMFCFIT